MIMNTMSGCIVNLKVLSMVLSVGEMGDGQRWGICKGVKVAKGNDYSTDELAVDNHMYIR